MLDLGKLKIGVVVDDSQASAGLSDLSQTIEKAESTANNASSSTNGLNNSLNNLSNESESATNSVNAFQVMCGNLAAKAVTALANTIKQNLGDAISRVDTLNNFTRTMESLGYSTEQADASIEKISDTIQPLPVALDEAAASSQKFTALYGDIEKGTDVWAAITNGAYAAGQGEEAATRAQDAWYKVLAKGTPEAENWQTLVETMPAQMNQLAQSLLGSEASSQDLFDAWKNGTVTTEEVTDAMQTLTDEGGDGFKSWADQAELANSGIQTSIENIKLAITRNMAKIIEPFSKDITEGAADACDAIDKIGDAIQPVVKFLEKISPILTPIIAALGTFVGVIGTYVAALKVATAVQTVFNAVMALNPFVLITAGVIALIAAIALLVKNWEKVKKLFSKAIKFIVNTDAFKKAKEWIQKVIEWWDKLKAKAKKAINFVVNTKNNQSKASESGSGGTKHRIGLREVPYDGYKAELHKGETILTAAETNLLVNRLNSAKPSGEQGTQENITTNTSNTNYTIGDITLDVSSIKDIPTIEDFVTMLTRAKAFA